SDERGRLCGWGTTRPRRRSTRTIELTEGARPRRRSRCHWIVSAPASSPWAKRSARRWTISWVTSGCSAVGERCGRRDRGARPASPWARYRESSLYSQLRCTPCTRASSATERPSRRCASTKYGPTSIRRPPQRGVSDVLTHPSRDCRRCPELPHGGAEGDRTPDLLSAIQALSQLSYSPD